MFCSYWKFQEILRRDVFNLVMKHLNGKYYLGYAGIPLRFYRAWTGWKTVWIHINVTTTL